MTKEFSEPSTGSRIADAGPPSPPAPHLGEQQADPASIRTPEVAEPQLEPASLKDLVTRLGVAPYGGSIPPTYLSWNAKILAFYFRPDLDGIPAFLSVEEHALRRLGEGYVEGFDAVESFLDAVRSLGGPDQLINTFLQMGVLWALGSSRGEPPFIAGLALCVLAASRMGGEPGEVASHNYYKWLNEGLGRGSQAGIPPGFDRMKCLWAMLNYWLHDTCGDRKGKATARQVGGYTHVGWPLSQALFRSADTQELLDLRDWIGAVDYEALEPLEIAARVRTWIQGPGWQSRLSRVLGQNPVVRDLEVVAEYLASVLPNLEEPEITANAGPGRRVARLHVHKSSYTWKNADVQLVWMVETDLENFHAQLDPPGKSVEVRVEQQWASVSFSLAEGQMVPLRVISREFGCDSRFNPQSPLILVRGDGRGRPGWWIQHDSLGAPGEPNIILCAESDKEPIEECLKGGARAGWKLESATAWLPKGWLLYTDITFTSPPSGILEQFLQAELVPWRLAGGIKIARDTWLLGALPIVDAPEEMVVSLLDATGRLLTSLRIGLGLDKLNLQPGAYKCRTDVGGTKRLIVISPTHPPTPRSKFRSLSLPGRYGLGAIEVSGASVAGEASLIDPLIIEGKKSVLILGNRIGEIARFVQKRATSRPYEPDITFVPQWIVALRNGREDRVIPAKRIPDPPDKSGVELQLRREWCNAIIGGGKKRLNGLSKVQLDIFKLYIKAAQGAR